MQPSINPAPDTPATPKQLAAELLSGSLHDYLLSTSDPAELADALAADLEKAGLLHPAACLSPGVGMEGPGPLLGYQVQCRLLTSPYWSNCRGGFFLNYPVATAYAGRLAERYPHFAHRIVTHLVTP